MYPPFKRKRRVRFPTGELNASVAQEWSSRLIIGRVMVQLHPLVLLRLRLTAGRGALNPAMKVRILRPQFPSQSLSCLLRSYAHRCTMLGMTKRIHLVVTVEQYHALRQESARTGVPVNEIIRRAIEARKARKKS